MIKLSCFKDYDIRGEIGIDIYARAIFYIGRAITQHLKAKFFFLECACETSPLFTADTI